MSSYKRLHVCLQIDGIGGNCQSQDDTLTLHCSLSQEKKAIDVTDLDFVCQHTVLSSAESPHEHDYASIPNYFTIFKCKKTAVGYISGYVTRMV